MTPDDLHLSLAKLAARRPLFHSEADLQHELAWQLREMLDGSAVRLERPFGEHPRMNIDLVVHHAGERVGIELKYWPRAWSGDH